MSRTSQLGLIIQRHFINNTIYRWKTRSEGKVREGAFVSFIGKLLSPRASRTCNSHYYEARNSLYTSTFFLENIIAPVASIHSKKRQTLRLAQVAQ